MEMLKDIISYFATKKYQKGYAKGLEEGLIKPFDSSFYAQFDGMYYNGLPIYYYLEKMSMGKCYDASAILALAMGKKANVCRGELKEMSKAHKSTFGHGWVECDGKVYDTTDKAIFDKEYYYKLFGVIDETVRTNEKFFEDCKHFSDWTIHTKEYYENNFVPLVNLGIFQVHQMAELILSHPQTSEKERAFYKKLKKDLPAYEKLILSPDVNVIKLEENEEPEC